MKALLVSLLALWAWNGRAATVLVSNEPAVTVNSGDTLEVEFSTPGFAGRSKGAAPSRISFLLAALPAEAAGPVFDATLDSADGSASVSVAAALEFVEGSIKSARYSGPASVLMGSLFLSPQQSMAIFGEDGKTAARLSLRASGVAPLTLEEPGGQVRRMFDISVSAGGLTVGSKIDGVSLDRAAGRQFALFAVEPELSEVPEPAGAGLAALGAGWCFWRWRRARRRSRIE